MSGGVGTSSETPGVTIADVVAALRHVCALTTDRACAAAAWDYATALEGTAAVDRESLLRQLSYDLSWPKSNLLDGLDRSEAVVAALVAAGDATRCVLNEYLGTRRPDLVAVVAANRARNAKP